LPPDPSSLSEVQPYQLDTKWPSVIPHEALHSNHSQKQSQ
jgi:hypothetical protein